MQSVGALYAKGDSADDRQAVYLQKRRKKRLALHNIHYRRYRHVKPYTSLSDRLEGKSDADQDYRRQDNGEATHKG